MTILRFFSDPHVGKELKANTTPASRAILAQQLHLHALQAAGLPHPQGEPVAGTLCGGDLFDTDTNPEHVLLAGAEVAGRCEVVLGGNHDVINIKGRASTLSALARLTGHERFVLPPDPGEPAYSLSLFGKDVAVFTVPHHARQQEFEEALKLAAEFASGAHDVGGKRKILLVHCNYNLTFEAGENDLNLTDAKARWLLARFDYIVMGHDHRPRRECDGRLIILGNTHPTSFSDQGTKYVWFYDSETNKWLQVVNASEASMAVAAEELLRDAAAGQLAKYSAIEWLDIHGSLPPEAAVDLAKAIRELRKQSNYLYAVRASKVLFIAEGQTNEVAPAAQKTLIEIVEEQLASSPDLLELFHEARELKE